MAPVRIGVSNGHGFLFDVKDIETVRVEHRIAGVLIGTLPQLGQQNVFLGVPMLLLPEQVYVLVKHGHAVIVDDVKAHKVPTAEQVAAYDVARQEGIDAENTAVEEADRVKRTQIDSMFQEEIEKRRKERKEKKAAALAAAGGADGLQAPEQDEEQKVVLRPHAIHIETLSLSLDWYEPTSSLYATLDSAREAGVWTHPATALELSRCRVFEELWSLNFWMGVGIRFGGDFLVYPGDSLRFHSHFTCTVLESPDTPILPLDLVSYGRLATAVKKAHLLGTWDKEKDEVTFFSLEWGYL